MEEKFNIVKKGYDPAEVNAYIDTLEKVLTSYKEKDNAIKNALINAQITADNIIKNAELEAEKIVGKAVDLMETISGSITEQKQRVDSFKEEYNALMAKYLHTINDQEIQKIYTNIDDLNSYLIGLKADSPLLKRKEDGASPGTND